MHLQIQELKKKNLEHCEFINFKSLQPNILESIQILGVWPFVGLGKQSYNHVYLFHSNCCAFLYYSYSLGIFGILESPPPHWGVLGGQFCPNTIIDAPSLSCFCSTTKCICLEILGSVGRQPEIKVVPQKVERSFFISLEFGPQNQPPTVPSHNGFGRQAPSYGRVIGYVVYVRRSTPCDRSEL